MTGIRPVKYKNAKTAKIAPQDFTSFFQSIFFIAAGPLRWGRYFLSF
jgi:hypothetical protein